MVERLQDYLIRCFSGEHPGPYILDINPTDRCNLHCRSCWQRNEQFEGRLDSSIYELSDDRLLELVDEAAELGVKRIEITGGGEPLCRKVTPELIRKIKGRKIFGGMTTNGTLFSEDLVRDMVCLGWDRIVFSIDGPDEKLQDMLRGEQGVFSRNMRCLKLFKALKAEAALPEIQFNSVISAANFRELGRLIALASEHGCSTVNFETLTVHSELGGKMSLTEDQIAELNRMIPGLQALAEKLGVHTNIRSFLASPVIENANAMKKIVRSGTAKNEVAKVPCFEPWYHLVVKVDGSAGPCCLFTDKKVSVKDESLSDIWHGSFFEALRRDMLGKRLHSYCRICNAGQFFRNREIREALLSGSKYQDRA